VQYIVTVGHLYVSSDNEFLSMSFEVREVLPELVDEYLQSPQLLFEDIQPHQRTLREVRPLLDLARLLG